ncbi:hypothetical protein EDD86DRAFT_210761 [Gorgonomyces haynaldii]|nr:hypothetical protein EDD86DRAFT_210761 [Gorgonomyces haynaldii]
MKSLQCETFQMHQILELVVHSGYLDIPGLSKITCLSQEYLFYSRYYKVLLRQLFGIRKPLPEMDYKQIAFDFHKWQKQLSQQLVLESPLEQPLSFMRFVSQTQMYHTVQQFLEPYCQCNDNTLDLAESQLHHLSDIIGGYHIRELNLEDNQLQHLPWTVVCLKELVWMNLDYNNINRLPDDFGSLKKLTEFYGFDNQLTFLPDSFCDLNLEKLHLKGNQLECLPNDFGRLSKLKTCYLDSNNLVSLPDSFGMLFSLTKLQLFDNPIVRLPDTFCLLKNLQELHLHYTLLLHLPKDFGNLKALRILYLDHTPLKALPPSFGRLHCLSTLALDFTQLDTLPEGFQDLRLESLSLDPQLQSQFESLGLDCQVTYSDKLL